jgi:hypothetical protein
VNKHPIANRPNVVKIGFRINFKNKQKNEHIYRFRGNNFSFESQLLQIITLENPEPQTTFKTYCLDAWIEVLDRSVWIEVLDEVLDRSAWIEVPGSKCRDRSV